MVLFYLCIGRTYLLVLNIYFVVLFIHWYRAARCENRYTWVYPLPLYAHHGQGHDRTHHGDGLSEVGEDAQEGAHPPRVGEKGGALKQTTPRLYMYVCKQG